MDIWVAEYSKTQNAFHVDKLKGILKKNCNMVAKKNNNDYLIFGIFNNTEQALKAVTKMRAVHNG